MFDLKLLDIKQTAGEAWVQGIVTGYFVNLGSYLLIMTMFSQYSIIMSDKEMIEDSPAQNPFHWFLSQYPTQGNICQS